MSSPSSSRGLLIVNLGTPESPSTADVRSYLAEFLMDPFVIDIPHILRWSLVHGLILRTRPKKSAQAYRSVWTADGSPLLVESEKFSHDFRVASKGKLPYEEIFLAMRYGNPSIKQALQKFYDKVIRRITIFAMYPQYAESSSRTAVEKIHEVAMQWGEFFDFDVVPAFYNHSGYSEALAEATRQALLGISYDHFLMTFHGLPKSHLLKIENNKAHCFRSETCCDVVTTVNQHCYRAQCYATARNLAAALNLPSGKWSVSFQSRLGPKWITPFTDIEIPRLAKAGKKSLVIISPAFVADCLETIEELGIRGKELFQNSGGREYHLIPCLNNHPIWIKGAISIVSDHLKNANTDSAFPFLEK